MKEFSFSFSWLIESQASGRCCRANESRRPSPVIWTWMTDLTQVCNLSSDSHQVHSSSAVDEPRPSPVEWLVEQHRDEGWKQITHVLDWPSWSWVLHSAKPISFSTSSLVTAVYSSSSNYQWWILLMLRSSKSKSFFNWKSNRIEIVFFVHPIKQFVHWSIGSLIDAVVALQKTDHSLQRGRLVFKLFICRRRPLGWSEREVRGRTGVNCSSPANKAHVQI